MYYRLHDIIYTYINISFSIYWENEFRLNPSTLSIRNSTRFLLQLKNRSGQLPPSVDHRISAVKSPGRSALRYYHIFSPHSSTMFDVMG